MEFDFSKDQKLVQESVREFLKRECPSDKVRELEEDGKGFDPKMWKQMAELGWMGIILPEEYHGTEGDFIDLMIVMEEMGRKLLPSPFSIGVQCSLLLLEYGNREQKEKYLPHMADGKAIWSFGLVEASGAYEAAEIRLGATQEGEEYILSGSKMFVPYAHVADYLLVAARTGKGNEKGITVFIVDAKSVGLATEVIPTTAHDKQCEVSFDNVKVPGKNILGETGRGWDVVNFILRRGAVLKSAEMLGGVQAALEMTNDYAKKRIQFGRPIGSFQAIQHKLADLFIQIEGLRYIVYEAAWMISIGSPSDLIISTAKAKANEVYQQTCIECIRVHGAIGVTREQDISLYHLRTRAFQFTMGDSNFHRERIAIELESYQAPIYE